MLTTENRSRVAQLRKQIDLEYQAARLALEGPAMVARHDFIQARMAAVQSYHEQLIALVGEEEAIRIIAEASEKHC